MLYVQRASKAHCMLTAVWCCLTGRQSTAGSRCTKKQLGRGLSSGLSSRSRLWSCSPQGCHHQLITALQLAWHLSRPQGHQAMRWSLQSCLCMLHAACTCSPLYLQAGHLTNHSVLSLVGLLALQCAPAPLSSAVIACTVCFCAGCCFPLPVSSKGALLVTLPMLGVGLVAFQFAVPATSSRACWGGHFCNMLAAAARHMYQSRHLCSTIQQAVSVGSASCTGSVPAQLFNPVTKVQL